MYKSGVYEPYFDNLFDAFHAEDYDDIQLDSIVDEESYHSVKILGWGIEKNVPYWVSDETK